MRRFLKIFLSFLIMVVGFTFTSSSINAASYPTSLNNVKKVTVLKYNGYESLYYKTSGNYKVFCTTFRVANVGTKCNLSSSQWSMPVQAGVAAIVKKYNSNQTQKNYYYSELAINEFLYYYSGKNSVNRISKTRDVRNTSGVKDFYNAAVKAYKDAKATYKLKLSASKINFKLSGDYYVSDKITVSAENGSVGNYKIALSGDVKSEVYKKSGNSFYVRVAKNSVKVGSSVNVKLSVDSTKTIDIVKRFDCGSNYQVLTPNTTDTTTLKSGVSISGTITLKGNTVKINKIDSETKKAVSGAKLVVKDAKGKEVATFVTTDKAYTLKNLEAGTYTVSEISAPIGYELSKKTVSFTVKNDDKEISVSFENEKLPNKVEISKQDITTKKELPGAHLVVKDSNGKEVDSWVSKNEAHIIADLKAGDYTLTETIAPEGYRLSTETVKFSVKGDGTTTKVVMYNEIKKQTIVKINKIDSETKQPLKGATLIIKDSKGNDVISFISGNQSYVLENLASGKYTVSELSAPEGYELSKETMEFTVGTDDKDITVNFLNTKKKVETRVEISKQDASTKEELPGAHLVVKDASGNEVDSWISTSEVHVIKGLEKGKYTLTETIAPNGYVLSEETIEFTINDDGTTTKVVMYNNKEASPVPEAPKNPSKHQVEISKQDITTKEELKGATLIIKDAFGNEIDKWVSSTTPHYVELDEGNYTLTEIQAPNGYDLSYEVIKFTVTDTTDIQKVVMYNSKTPNTSDKSIGFIVSMMAFSLVGMLGATIKIKKMFN